MPERELLEALAKLGLTLEKTVEIAHEHTLAVQAWLSSRTPNAEQMQGTGTMLSSGGLHIDLSNLALGALYPP